MKLCLFTRASRILPSHESHNRDHDAKSVSCISKATQKEISKPSHLFPSLHLRKARGMHFTLCEAKKRHNRPELSTLRKVIRLKHLNEWAGVMNDYFNNPPYVALCYVCFEQYMEHTNPLVYWFHGLRMYNVFDAVFKVCKRRPFHFINLDNEHAHYSVSKLN